nr:hypothetical protein [Streptomyces acidiscabies]
MRVQTVPDQDDGAFGLLVSGVEQAGAVSLGEALAPPLVQISAAIETVWCPQR